VQAWEGPGGGVFVIDDDVRVQSRGMGFRVAARLPGSDGLQVPYGRVRTGTLGSVIHILTCFLKSWGNSGGPIAPPAEPCQSSELDRKGEEHAGGR
jgi:hypothetical protein